MYLIYAIEVPLFFSVIPELNSFVPSWLDFKNFFALKVGLLQAKALANSYFHLQIILECS
jgi:hypothetical protein